jgi:hypothetical protein
MNELFSKKERVRTGLKIPRKTGRFLSKVNPIFQRSKKISVWSDENE